MNTKPMRLIRPEPITTRQQEALEAIRKAHEKDNWTPIIPTYGGEALPTDAILRKSYRLTDSEL